MWVVYCDASGVAGSFFSDISILGYSVHIKYLKHVQSTDN